MIMRIGPVFGLHAASYRGIRVHGDIRGSLWVHGGIYGYLGIYRRWVPHCPSENLDLGFGFQPASLDFRGFTVWGGCTGVFKETKTSQVEVYISKLSTPYTLNPTGLKLSLDLLPIPCEAAYGLLRIALPIAYLFRLQC